MRWPWVSRAYLNDMLAQAEKLNQSFHEEARIAQRVERETAQRYDSLLARYHMLKLQGAVEQEPQRTPVTPIVDPVTQAVNKAAAGYDDNVRRTMLDGVARDRANNVPDDVIIARLSRRSRPAEDVA